MDFYLFQQINQLAGKWPALDKLAVFFAEYFGYFLIFFFFLFLVKNFKKYWSILLKAFGAAVLARFVVVDIIRWLWERPRPFVENQVNLLLPREMSASFPSGHAAVFFAISTIVYIYNKKAGVLFFVASFLISIARIFVGVHWPLDILGGLIVGMFSGWLINKLLRKF